MIARLTHGVKVTVESFYQAEHSNPVNQEFIFAYQVTIENFTNSSLKLLRRNWHIFDSNGNWKNISGEGVVGQQPVIEPGDFHQYVSGCHLRTEIGKMYGHYEMVRLSDGRLFQVSIPEFVLIAPFKLN